MDGLELHVREPDPNQRGQAVFAGVEKALERGHAVGHGSVRRRHEGGGSGPGAAKPVLGRTKLAGHLPAASPARQQHAVNFADQAVAQGEAARQAMQAMFQRRHVVGDLDDVVEGRAGRLLQLVEQQVGERRLRPLYLGGEHRLLAHVGVEKQRLIRQQRRDGIQPAEREGRRLEHLLERTVQGDGRRRRQRRRHEGAYALAARARRLVPAALAALHGLDSRYWRF